METKYVRCISAYTGLYTEGKIYKTLIDGDNIEGNYPHKSTSALSKHGNSNYSQFTSSNIEEYNLQEGIINQQTYMVY